MTQLNATREKRTRVGRASDEIIELASFQLLNRHLGLKAAHTITYHGPQIWPYGNWSPHYDFRSLLSIADTQTGKAS